MKRDLSKNRGSFAIPMTPFDKRDRIDEKSLAKEIEFCIDNNASGLCTPAMVSEFELLSEEERKIMIRVPLEVNQGRLPVIANIAAQNTPLAVELAEYAEEHGADMVMAMPPYVVPLEFEQIIHYYEAISRAVDLPIMLQNVPTGNQGLGIKQVEILFNEVDRLAWVKQELNPQIVAIATLMEKNIPSLKGVMSGLGGLNLPYDFRLGVTACIHACQFCDVIAFIWNLFEQDENEKAMSLFYSFLPGIVLEMRYGWAFDKEIMVKRGIFNNHTIRRSAKPLDEKASEEIDEFWQLYNREILAEMDS